MISHFQQALGEARAAMKVDDSTLHRRYDGIVRRYGADVAREAWKLACDEADAEAEKPSDPITILTELLDSLPAGHPDRPGVARSIEVLKYP